MTRALQATAAARPWRSARQPGALPPAAYQACHAHTPRQPVFKHRAAPAGAAASAALPAVAAPPAVAERSETPSSLAADSCSAGGAVAARSAALGAAPTPAAGGGPRLAAASLSSAVAALAAPASAQRSAQARRPGAEMHAAPGSAWRPAPADGGCKELCCGSHQMRRLRRRLAYKDETPAARRRVEVVGPALNRSDMRNEQVVGGRTVLTPAKPVFVEGPAAPDTCPQRRWLAGVRGDTSAHSGTAPSAS